MSQGNAIDLNIAFGGARDLVAAHISTFYTQWESSRNLANDRWDESYKYIFATSTRDTTNETVTNWSNTTHRPKIANIFDALTINYDAALFPNDRWLKWKGADQESASINKRKLIEAYLQTKHRLRSSGFREQMRLILSDWVWTGNAFAQVDYVNEIVEDPETGEQTTAYTGPKVTRIDPRNIVMNPTATSFQAAPKIIRTLFTFGELERIVQERPDQQHFRDVLEIAKQNRSVLRQFQQGDILEDSELSFDGFGTPMEYINSGLIEVLEFYGDMYIHETGEFKKNHVITVVDRWRVVRDEPVHTWTGRPHIYHVGWRERPGNLWAMGPLDNLIGLQYRINHLENARADAFDQMIDPDIVFAGDIEEIMQVGGAKHYYIAENGNVAHLRPDTTVLNADLQIQELEEKMELYALAPREALGIRSPGEKTAFEVSQLATASSRAFEHKVLKFQELLEQIANAELEVAVRNLNSQDIIEIVDDDLGAVEFKTVTKKDITANGRLIPVGARHFSRAAQLSQTLLGLQQGPLADPEVRQHFSSRKLAELYHEALDLDIGQEGLVQPYVRISEQLEAQRRLQAAQDAVAQEGATDTSGGVVDAGPEAITGGPVPA
jgi:transcriptional regulator NrdR family protein